MKQILFPAGNFQTQVEVRKNEDDDLVQRPFRITHIPSMSYHMEKTCPILVKYEKEKEDEHDLWVLEQDEKDARYKLAHGKCSTQYCQTICDRHSYFRNIYNCASNGTVGSCMFGEYKEYMDNSPNGCQAMYILNGEEFPVKVGEPLVYRYNWSNYRFEMIRL